MRRIALIVLTLFLCALHASAAERPADAFPLRNHNPFLQIYGLPTFQTAELVAPGGLDFNVSIDFANDADDADREGEVLVIDSESRVINLSLRRRFMERFEFGLDVPYVNHSAGFLDGLIYDFHDLVGLSNSSREGSNDQFRLLFGQGETTYFDMTSSQSGIGDVQVSAAMRFGRMTLRTGVKLPTGDPDKLTGSGATDFSIGAYGTGTTTFFDRDLSYSGFLGVLALGDGDVLPEFQRDIVPYGGLALRWHTTERLSLATQWYVQGSYLDVALDELGGETFQLAFGADYRFPETGLLLRLAIVEDIAAAAAPDFAFHLSLRRYTR